MLRRILFATVAVALTCTSAHAQIITAGSTPQGDYLRGAGIAGWGMGLYNLYTAQAESINTDTAIKWNEYVAAVADHSRRMYLERVADVAAKDKELYNKIRQRIEQNPEERDVLNGDALNAVLQSILDSKVGESTFRSPQFQVSLSVDLIRKIPFKLSEKGEKFSMNRLSVKGKGKWPVALQDDRFELQRRSYERVLDKALDQAIDGKVQIPAIEAVEAAADNLLDRLNQVVTPSSDRLYLEAKERIINLKDTARLLKTHKIELAIGELDKYAGTTVNDLKMFMQAHGLRFAKAETPEERRLFPELYASLIMQRDKVAILSKAPGN
jgi:hypothetical protein